MTEVLEIGVSRIGALAARCLAPDPLGLDSMRPEESSQTMWPVQVPIGRPDFRKKVKGTVA